jgi:parallel beta-helix repeat protein
MRALVAAAFVIVLFTVTLDAKTWKVSAMGLGDYPTINQALLVAKDGDTIKVYPGKYEEKVVVSKNVVIQGSGAEATTISNQNHDYAVEMKAGKMMWVMITSPDTGGKAEAGEFRNCVARGCGVGFTAYTAGKIVNCVAILNRVGFWIANSNKPIISNCIAYKNTNYGFGSGADHYDVVYCCSYSNGQNYANWCCYYGAYSSTGSLEVDPKFDGSSYALSVTSPCKDAGNPGYKDPDGTAADMGYYGGDDAPTFPVVKEAKIILNTDGTIDVQATGVSPY